MAKLGAPSHTVTAAGTAVSAELVTAARRFPFRHEVEGAPVAQGVEPWVAASLLLAMRTGESTLRVPAPCSPRLLAGLARIQEIFHVWDRRFRPVVVEAPAGASPSSAGGGRGVACFFSGGVDSFYTALKHGDGITALVFVEGWDPPLADLVQRRAAAAAVAAMAGALGKPLVRVVTNLAPVVDSVLPWRFYQGAALASIALLLAPGFHRVLIPATHSYADLYPLGTHPLVDPLWSTEATELVHDGCEATRSERVARIARHPAALRWLRVCWEARDGAANCGTCEKCLRTMIGLRLAGALERCSAFTRPLDLDAVAAMDVRSVHARAYAVDNLRAAEASGEHPDLVAALRACLARPAPVTP
jgi:pimeloyl-ACP methyl ester carboxylesterase